YLFLYVSVLFFSLHYVLKKILTHKTINGPSSLTALYLFIKRLDYPCFVFITVLYLESDEVNKMDKLEKSLQIIMWVAVVSLIVIAVLAIIVRHTTDYIILFGTQDLSHFVLSTFNNGKLM